ncbi:MAG: RiPP maturation radical SAM C-methyltransferase [Methylocystis silviterrae]|uniref:RiPP maturation radical SAM C-methyltransferase n=1 Tax=Methylocystis silviterrae TaxID=2743612 RepID=UPI003C75ACA1
MASNPALDPDLSSLGGGDALIIVPPFAGLRWPSLGVHQIQASAAREGFDVRVLYANLLFAACIGEETYRAIGCVRESTAELIGERFFAAPAFGRTPLALSADGSDDDRFAHMLSQFGSSLSLADFRKLEAQAQRWIEGVADEVAALGFPIVGASTTFEQTSAAIALLAAVKRRRPETITIVGGGNCEGPMAEGIMSLGAPIDYVFSGESEDTFVAWLRAVKSGSLPTERIIRGEIQFDMDQLPAPDYRSWFAQRARFLESDSVRPESDLFVTYETSRGCWWGAKHHCTFCGLNGTGMRYREKSAEKVVEDLRALVEQCPTRFVWIVDNIMPHHYFRTLLPRLQEEVPGIRLFYEVKSNLSFEKIQLLQSAGVVAIQPGVEALSTKLLRLMDKGVTTAQNLALLRHAASFGIRVDWNLLYRFPGDSLEAYEQTLALMPLLRHLPPPNWVGPLRVDRFSPYYEQAARYGLRNLRPLPAYAAVLPPGARADLVAYTFLADFESAVDDRIEADIVRVTTEWAKSWCNGRKPPSLHVFETRPGVYFLLDTRGVSGDRPLRAIDAAKARAALISKQSRNRSAEQAAARQWALEERIAVEVDGEYVPLAMASPDLLARFEAEAEIDRSLASAEVSRARDETRRPAN